MKATTATPPDVTPLDEYVPIIGEPEVNQLNALAAPLRGRTVQMVNSTAVGGGVAEILARLVPLLKELSLSVRWDVLKADNEFFEITKAMHNGLHGGDYRLPPESFRTFLRYNEENRSRLVMDSEFTEIHDPQPVALIPNVRDGSGHWIWRCHLDLSQPNPTVWKFLEPWVQKYDAALFSSPDFAQQLSKPQYVFYPCIDPLSDKNRTSDPRLVRKVLEQNGIDRKRPILTQVSRFDRLKDPVGVIRAYRIVKRFFNCQLVLAGGQAKDDPEGREVLAEVMEAAAGDPDIHCLDLPPSPTTISALQQASTIIIQKSLKEGFGLSVTEALWKKKPVVASAVGGIPLQVIHKHTGLLAHSVDGAAYQIRYLLSNPAVAKKLGEQGHAHVRQHFLMTAAAKRYLTLFLHLLKSEA